MNHARYAFGVPRKPPKMGPHRRSAEWAQAILKHHGISQEKFAELANLSRGGLTKVLYGQQRPRFDTLRKLSAIAPDHLKDFEKWDRETGGPKNWPREPAIKPLDEGRGAGVTYPPAEVAKTMNAEIAEVVRLMEGWPEGPAGDAARRALRDEAHKKNRELLANPIEADRAIR